MLDMFSQEFLSYAPFLFILFYFLCIPSVYTFLSGFNIVLSFSTFCDSSDPPSPCEPQHISLAEEAGCGRQYTLGLRTCTMMPHNPRDVSFN